MLTYLLQTWGELALSPIGLSAFSKYSPKRYMGQMFGLWFLASAIGGVLAGLLGGDAMSDGLLSIEPIFAFMIKYYLVIAVILIALSFIIKAKDDFISRINMKASCSQRLLFINTLHKLLHRSLWLIKIKLNTKEKKRKLKVETYQINFFIYIFNCLYHN